MIIEFLDSIFKWVSIHMIRIISSLSAIIIIYVIYRFLMGRTALLLKQRKLREGAANILKRILQWGAGLAILAVVVAQFGVDVGFFVGLLTLAGGTIIGFASMNTIGNAISGLIIMIIG